jgi:thioesterase domain-containing protein
MAREYRPTTRLDAPALIVRASGSGPRADDLGWSEWIRGPISVVEVAGAHLDLLRHPTVLEVGAHLRAAFDRVQ